MKRSYLSLPALAFVAGLVGCAAGNQLGNPTLSSLDAQLSSHNGEVLEPRFNPDIHEYTLKVQSDIFGVLLKPSSAAADVTMSSPMTTSSVAMETRGCTWLPTETLSIET